jgi:3-oxoadipate enol-lactonase
MTMLIKANGIEIHCELAGKPGAPVVILSHSLASSMVMWEPQRDVLEESFRVLQYDMRGHGDSEVVKGSYTLESLGSDVIGLMDALNIESAHFIGLSIGGMIGQGLALDHADRLLSVILCDTAPILPEEAKPPFEVRMNQARELGMASLAEETLSRWFTAPFLEKDPPVVNQIRRQILATPVEGFIGCSHAIMGLNYLDRLSEINLDTLIIVGEKDSDTMVAGAKAIHAEVRNSELVILPSAAHLSNIEQADGFNRAISLFLQSCSKWH